MRKTGFLLAFAVLVCAFLLAGCSPSNFKVGEEDMSQTRELGEACQVDYEYRLLLMHFGPYKLQITPLELVHLGGDDGYDCVKIQYRVISTANNKAADYANCVCAVALLDENLNEVENEIWFKDAQMNNADVHGALEIGQDYSYYIPITRGIESSGLRWLVVSDREGTFLRNGDNYYYRIDPESLR